MTANLNNSYVANLSHLFVCGTAKQNNDLIFGWSGCTILFRFTKSMVHTCAMYINNQFVHSTIHVSCLTNYNLINYKCLPSFTDNLYFIFMLVDPLAQICHLHVMKGWLLIIGNVLLFPSTWFCKTLLLHEVINTFFKVFLCWGHKILPISPHDLNSREMCSIVSLTLH